jgi:hypothetical protein
MAAMAAMGVDFRLGHPIAAALDAEAGVPEEPR